MWDGLGFWMRQFKWCVRQLCYICGCLLYVRRFVLYFFSIASVLLATHKCCLDLMFSDWGFCLRFRMQLNASISGWMWPFGFSKLVWVLGMFYFWFWVWLFRFSELVWYLSVTGFSCFGHRFCFWVWLFGFQLGSTGCKCLFCQCDCMQSVTGSVWHSLGCERQQSRGDSKLFSDFSLSIWRSSKMHRLITVNTLSHPHWN